MRAIRVVRLFDELRTIVASMVNSITTLLWALVLLVMMVYVFSVLSMQVILDKVDIEKDDTLKYWFGSLSRTVLTMFECIVGGVDWDHVVQPLITHVSPAMGIM